MKGFISEVSIFHGLSDTDIAILEKSAAQKKVLKDQIIFQKGDSASQLFIVIRGLVKLFRARKGSEKEEIVCVIPPKGYFCLAPMLSRDVLHISAKTLEDSNLLILPKKIILDLIDRSHMFSKNVIQAIASKECALCEEVCALSLSTTKERLAKYLFYLYERSKKPIQLSLNQSQLASHLGTVRETLSRDFSALKKAKILESKGNLVTILKPEDLARIAEPHSYSSTAFTVL